MPIYEFQCTSCRHLFEELFPRAVDKPTAKCPECGGKSKKLISNVGIVFKGSGFYVTDSRAVETKSKTSGTKVETKSEGSSESSSETPKTESTTETKSEPKAEKKSKPESKSED